LYPISDLTAVHTFYLLRTKFREDDTKRLILINWQKGKVLSNVLKKYSTSQSNKTPYIQQHIPVSNAYGIFLPPPPFPGHLLRLLDRACSIGERTVWRCKEAGILSFICQGF